MRCCPAMGEMNLPPKRSEHSVSWMTLPCHPHHSRRIADSLWLRRAECGLPTDTTMHWWGCMLGNGSPLDTIDLPGHKDKDSRWRLANRMQW